MANTNSNIASAHTTAQTDGRAPLAPLASGAMPVFIRGRVTCPATPTVNDTLTLVPGELIPAGARYAPELNTDALADALALTTAGTTGGLVPFDESGTAPLAMTSDLEHVSGEDIVATVMTSTSVVETVIEFAIAYYAKI